MDLADRTWPLLRRLMNVHTLAYKTSHGVIGHRLPGLPPMLLLDHVGAKSGRTRTSPLLYIRDGDNLVIVASKGGYPKHPGWFHNLRAHPDVEFGGKPLRAKVVEDEAGRARLWQLRERVFPPDADHRERAAPAGRTIPIVQVTS